MQLRIGDAVVAAESPQRQSIILRSRETVELVRDRTGVLRLLEISDQLLEEPGRGGVRLSVGIVCGGVRRKSGDVTCVMIETVRIRGPRD